MPSATHAGHAPGKEVDERGVVHGVDRVEPVFGRLRELDARRPQLVGEGVAALGLLVARQPHTEPVPTVGA